MDAESFRWLAGLAFLVVTALLGIIWKSILSRIDGVQGDVGKLRDSVMLDMRGLDVRVTWLEAHSSNGGLRHRIADGERTGG